MRTKASPETKGTGCCAPTGAQSLERERAEELAGLLKAVAVPARLQLLAFNNSQENAEACVCDLADAVGLSQPTVSHHLKVLVDAGFLTRSRRGYWAWYTAVPDRLHQVVSMLA